MRGFEIDCRIKHFNGRVQSGEKMKYIIGDKVMQVLLVEDDQTLFQELKKIRTLGFLCDRYR